LLGFESPLAGSIYYDRQELARLDLHGVRRQIGVVAAERPADMAGDILTNIIGSSLLTLDDAWEAAELSGLADDLRQMPMGMHTVLTEGAAPLSGGQRQRLDDCQALVSKPPILRSMKPPAALDNRTQAKIVSRSLGAESHPHRRGHIVSARSAGGPDCVLEGGRIVAARTYDVLIRQGGLFGELARRQLIASESGEDVR